MQKHVIVQDPTGNFPPGTLIDDGILGEFVARGIVSLPCEPALFDVAGHSVFAKREYGQGFPLAPTPGYCCPVSIYLPPGAPKNVHWVARLVPEAKRSVSGSVRLVAAMSRGNVYRPNLSEVGNRANAVVLESLRSSDLDSKDGWVVRGGASITGATAEGMYGFSLYGHGLGVRVAWLAISVSARG
jgi:hypothetical protein